MATTLYRYARKAKPRWAEGQGDQWRYALVSPFPARGAGTGRGFLAGPPQRPKTALPRVPGSITGQPSALGSVFGHSKGLTLYSAATLSACSGECLETWKPLPAPILARRWAIWTLVTRPDGTLQRAYKGKPLYRFAKDVKAGDTNGENADWRAVSVPASAASASPASAPSSRLR